MLEVNSDHDPRLCFHIELKNVLGLSSSTLALVLGTCIMVRSEGSFPIGFLGLQIQCPLSGIIV
jgi:hypothetical protein